VRRAVPRGYSLPSAQVALELGDGEAVVRERHGLRGLGLGEGELGVGQLDDGADAGVEASLTETEVFLGGLDRPTAGHAWSGELDLATADDARITAFRRHHVGFIFQFYNLIPSLTAAENVELVTEVADNPMGAAEALDLVGLAQRREHFPAQLSGGEQQRVAIARAIAKRPDVLLCDEPTGALDVATGIRVLETIVRANEELGTTTLLITHNADIASMGDRVIRFADGAIRSIDVNTARARPGDLHW